MSTLAFGLFEGIPIIGLGRVLLEYGACVYPGTPIGYVDHIPLTVTLPRRKFHTFYAMNKEDINLLAGLLSKHKQTELTISYGLHILKMWHRGQVVAGQRTPKDFYPEINREEDERYTF